MIDISTLNSEVKVKVVAGKTALTLRQLSELQSGSILELDRRIDDMVDIYVNDTLVAKGRLFTENDELIVKIAEIVNDGETA